MSSRDTQLIYIDESNMHIGGQLIAGTNNGLEKSDPRWRCNIRDLLTCAFGHKLGPKDSVTVYSSVRDEYTVNIFDSCDPDKSVCGSFLVKKFVRNAANKEKQVDVCIAIDMVATATRIHIEAQLGVRGAAQRKQDAVFTIMSGDMDLLPAVNMILSYGMRVNVCAFKYSLSFAYVKLAETNPALKLTMLDERIAAFSFYNFHSTNKTFERNNTVTIDLPPHDHRSTIVNDICCHLLKVKKLFCIVDDDADSTKLNITFPFVTAACVIPKLRLLLDLPISLYNNTPEPIVKSVASERANIFSVLEHEDSDDTAAAASASSSDGRGTSDSDSTDDEFKEVTVKRQDRRARESAARRIGTRCPNELHCPYAARCTMVHTDGEKALFSRYNKINFAYWKAQMCNSPHSHPADTCSFAHSESDSWCLLCKRFKHSTDNCPLSAFKTK